MSFFDDVQRQSIQAEQAEQDGKQRSKLSAALFGDDGSKRRQALSGVKNGLTGSLSKIKDTVKIGKPQADRELSGGAAEDASEAGEDETLSPGGKHSKLGSVFLGGEGSKRRQAVAATTGTVTKAADSVKDAVVSLPGNVKGAVVGGVEGIKKGGDDGLKKVAELHKKASEKVMIAGGKVAGKIKNVLPQQKEEREKEVERGDVVGAVGATVKKTLKKAGSVPVEALRQGLQTAEENVYWHNRANQPAAARHAAPADAGTAKAAEAEEGGAKEEGAVELEMLGGGGREETPHERVRRLVEERRQRMARGEVEKEPYGAARLLSLNMESDGEEEGLVEVLDTTKLGAPS